MWKWFAFLFQSSQLFLVTYSSQQSEVLMIFPVCRFWNKFEEVSWLFQIQTETWWQSRFWIQVSLILEPMLFSLMLFLTHYPPLMAEKRIVPGREVSTSLWVKDSLRKQNEVTKAWWLSGKESACQWGRHEFDPWSRRIPQAMEQLSLYATTPDLCYTSHMQLLKPACLESVLYHKRSHCCEKPMHHN